MLCDQVLASSKDLMPPQRSMDHFRSSYWRVLPNLFLLRRSAQKQQNKHKGLQREPLSPTEGLVRQRGRVPQKSPQSGKIAAIGRGRISNFQDRASLYPNAPHSSTKDELFKKPCSSHSNQASTVCQSAFLEHQMLHCCNHATATLGQASREYMPGKDALNSLSEHIFSLFVQP